MPVIKSVSPSISINNISGLYIFNQHETSSQESLLIKFNANATFRKESEPQKIISLIFPANKSRSGKD